MRHRHRDCATSVCAAKGTFCATEELSNPAFATITERRRIRKRSRCNSVENERLVARGISRSRKRGKALKREESRSFLPRLHRASPYLPPCALANTPERIGATRYEGLARRYAAYVTFARCKCVVPHAISWSNGPWSRGSYSHNHARVSSCSCTDKHEKNRTIIGAANRFRERRGAARRGGAQDSGEQAKY